MSDRESEAGRTPAPLRISAVNPRYFAVASGNDANEQIVYLVGSHVNHNFHDGLGFGADCPDEPEVFDFDAYLTFLVDHGHNFIRLWRWEQFKGHLAVGGGVHFCMTPQPWLRTGPGPASDGKPKFDLSAFDHAYFDRLRDRVVAAGRQGIYVSVMLFEGFSLHLTEPPDNIQGHPYHAGNNINGIGIDSIVDYQVLPLDPRVQAFQEAYIRKVVDTVHDLSNVLYEVANESSGQTADSVEMPGGISIPTPIGDSTQWQYWVIDVVKRYERSMGYDAHPIGMTYMYPVPDQAKSNEPLWASRADWISPGMDDTAMPGTGRWLEDPPANDGAKVVISDSDHYAPFGTDAAWAWKSFLRGHNPILYDLGIVAGVNPPDPSAGTPSYASLEPARYALGDTLRFARRVNLAAMTPRGDLSSTGYALANPGGEYLVLQPAESAEAFTVNLVPATYAVEWHSLATREAMAGGELTVAGDGRTVFPSPFTAGPAVLYLKRT
jgi:hypothetical protein